MSEQASINKGTVKVGALTALSRLLGFVREALTARLLGTSPITDAYFVALRIPNLFRSILAEGAFSSAFVPLFARALAISHQRAQEFLHTSFVVVGSLALLVALAGCFFAREFVDFFAPGFAPEHGQVAAELTAITFPYIVLITVTSLLGSVLTALKLYGTASWAQVLLNVTLIAGGVAAFFFDSSFAAYILATSLVIGGAVGVCYQLPILWRKEFALFPRRGGARRQHARDLLVLMAPALVTSGVYQLEVFLGTMLASFAGSGTLATIFYAERLAHLPYGILVVSLGTVLLPSLSDARARQESSRFAELLTENLLTTLAMLLPVCVGLSLCAAPLIGLAYRGGAFSAEAVQVTSNTLQILSLAIFFVGIQNILTKGFLASLNTRLPAVLAIVALGVQTAVSLMLLPKIPVEGFITKALAYVQDLLPQMGIAIEGAYALSWAQAAGAGAALGTLVIASVILRLPLRWGQLAFEGSKITGCTALAGVVTLAIQHSPIYQTLLLHESSLADLLRGVILGGVFLLVLVLSALVMRAHRVYRPLTAIMNRIR